jgi:hypothetical protein
MTARNLISISHPASKARGGRRAGSSRRNSQANVGCRGRRPGVPIAARGRVADAK